MTDNQLPTAPAAEASAAEPVDPPARRTWRDRLPSGRKAVATGAVVAGLAIGGAGFGAGYAVADSGADDAATQTTGTDWDDRGMPGDRGPRGDLDGGQLPGGPMGGTTQGDGSTAPDLDGDGDGQPDTDSDSDSDSDSNQNS